MEGGFTCALVRHAPFSPTINTVRKKILLININLTEYTSEYYFDFDILEYHFTQLQLSDEKHKRPGSRTAEGSNRVTAMLLLTLPGTPFVLYGDEIAMEDSGTFSTVSFATFCGEFEGHTIVCFSACCAYKAQYKFVRKCHLSVTDSSSVQITNSVCTISTN